MLSEGSCEASEVAPVITAPAQNVPVGDSGPGGFAICFFLERKRLGLWEIGEGKQLTWSVLTCQVLPFKKYSHSVHEIGTDPLLTDEEIA
jgi:hypothetical protein